MMGQQIVDVRPSSKEKSTSSSLVIEYHYKLFFTSSTSPVAANLGRSVCPASLTMDKLKRGSIILLNIPSKLDKSPDKFMKN